MQSNFGSSPSQCPGSLSGSGHDTGAGAASQPSATHAGYYAAPGQEDADLFHESGSPGIDAAEREIDVACNRSMTAGQAAAAVIGGAGVGAMLMYLFDSDKGPERRHHLADMAGSTWDTIRDKAGEYGSVAYDRAGRLKDRVAHSGLGTEAYDRARYLVRGKPEHHGIDSGLGQLFAGLGVLAAGGAAMYYFDPERGAARRNQCAQKMHSAFNRMFRKLDGLGKDLMNRSRGMVHDARSATSREQVDDHVLGERIRSEIGRCVSNTGAIDVVATDGTVIVSGFVQRSEHDPLLKCIWGVRGVNQLINRLEIRDADQFNRAALMQSTTTGGLACPPGLGSIGTTPNPT